MQITFEKNEYDEDVKVTTLPNGVVIRELDIQFVQEESSNRKLTPFQWRRLFTRAEKIAIEMASIDDSSATLQQRQLSAALRSYLKDQESAQFIDLDDPFVLSGLENLEMMGLIPAARVAEILAGTMPE
jgi:hypothetical protein